MEELRRLFQEIDKAMMNVDALRKSDKSLQFHQDQISSSAHFLTELMHSIAQASKREPERIGTSVSQLITYLQPFTHHTINYVSCMVHRHEKILLLEQIKALVETSLQLVLSTKEAGGNMKNNQWHQVVGNNGDLLAKLVHKLVQTLHEQSSANGLLNGLCDNIRQLISTLDTTTLSNQGHFQEYQTRMVDVLRQMARTIKEINDSIDIRHLANQLAREFNEVVNATYGAIGTAATSELAARVRKVVQDLGTALVALIERLGQNKSKAELETHCQKVIERVGRFALDDLIGLLIDCPLDFQCADGVAGQYTRHTSVHQCRHYRQRDHHRLGKAKRSLLACT